MVEQDELRRFGPDQDLVSSMAFVAVTRFVVLSVLLGVFGLILRASVGTVLAISGFIHFQYSVVAAYNLSKDPSNRSGNSSEFPNAIRPLARPPAGFYWTAGAAVLTLIVIAVLELHTESRVWIRYLLVSLAVILSLNVTRLVRRMSREARCSDARNDLIGSAPRTSPPTRSKVFWIVAVPSLVYMVASFGLASGVYLSIIYQTALYGVIGFALGLALSAIAYLLSCRAVRALFSAR